MSIKEFFEKLSLMREEYNSLCCGQRESPYGTELLSEIEQLDEALKQEEGKIEITYKDRIYGTKRQRFIDKIRRRLGRIP